MTTKKPPNIQITHFINPHLFWYKTAGKSNVSQKSAIEYKLSEFAKRCYNQKFAENVGAKIAVSDYVAVYYLNEKKWIRATVEKINPSSDGSMILWADDYGFPMECSKNLVISLDDELKQLCLNADLHVYRAGIHGIMPASYQLNSDKELVKYRKEQWDDEAVQKMKVIIESRKCEFQFKCLDFAEGSEFGDLVIITESKSELARSYLIKARYAMLVEEFKEVIAKSATIQMVRWLDNASKLNCISNKGQLPDDRTSTELPRIARHMMLNSLRMKKQNEKGPGNTGQSTSARQSQFSDASTSSGLRSMNSQKTNSTGNTLESSQSIASNRNNAFPQSKKFELLRRFRGITKAEPDSWEQTPVALTKNCSNSESNIPISESEKNRSPIVAKKSQPVTPSLKEFNEHSGLICRAKWQSVFLRNNEEYPIESITDANFTQSTYKAMKNANCMEVYPLQSYAWPNILRGNSVLMIESKNRGKTLAYLPALCSSVRRDQENDPQTHGQMGAIAIVIAMSDSVPIISRFCRELLGYENYKNTVIEGVRGEECNIEAICYGCSILITTVPSLCRLMDNPFMINNDKLKYIAIENIDVLMEKHRNLQKLLSKLAFDKGKNPRQLMVTSRIWNAQFKEFVTKCDAVLLIGNFFEAAAYLNIKIEFKFCLAAEKNKHVLDRIKSMTIDNNEKTLIICEKFAEVQDLASFLDSTGITYRVAQHLESEFEFGKLKSYWNVNKGIVICCDETVNDTKIRNATHVIHYSLPSSNFRCFENRFITQIEQPSDSRGTSWVLFNENNQRQFPKVVNLLRRYQQELPKHFEDIELKIRSEMMKIRQCEHQFEPVCNHVFLHASTEVHEHKACMKRHALLPTDIATDENDEPLYVNQELRFHLLKIISPSEYIVRPLKQRTSNGWKDIMRSDESMVFKMRFHVHYVNSNNQIRPDTIKLGQLCVILVNETVPHRAEIIHIFPKKRLLDDETYNVQLIDTGEILKRSRRDIFKLDPGEFIEFPRQAYTMHLIGIQPSNGENDWSSNSIRVFQNRIKKLENDFQNILYDARVIFSLRDAFVVDKIRAADTINMISHLIFEKELVDKKLGIACQDVITRVKHIAKEAGVNFERKNEPIVEGKPTANVEDIEKSRPFEGSVSSDKLRETIASKKQRVPPDDLNNSSAEANVEMNLIDFSVCSNSAESEPWYEEPTRKEFTEKWTGPPSIERGRIFITNFCSPDNFYINYDTNERKELQRAIDEHINNLGQDPDCSIECPDIGEYCLVKCGDQFDRGKIIGVDYSDISVKIFCVDTGSVVTTGLEQVYDLPDHLLKKLPFQVIWCRLAGILPKLADDVWKEEDIDLIYDEIDNYHENLYAYHVPNAPEFKSKFFEINISRCDVVLVATEDANQINLNMFLVSDSVDLAKLEDEFDTEIMDKIPFVEEEESWDSLQPDAPGAPAASDQIDVIQNAADVQPEIDDSGEMFINFTHDEAQDIIAAFLQPSAKKTLQTLESSVQAIEPAIQTETKPKPTNSIETEFLEKTIQPSPLKGQLVYKHKRPLVCWRQDKQWIVITIKADDRIKYNLRVTEDSLIYSAIQNDDKYKAVINFFGCIEPQLTKHVLRGLNVVVRLKKSNFWLWPRFCRSAYKCSWITSNLERMIFDDAAKEEYYEYAMDPIMKELNAIDRRPTEESDGDSENIVSDEELGDDSDYDEY